MDARTILLIFHLVGLALGLGGATVSDVMFLRAIWDKKLTNDEYGVLKVLSRIVWAGITILILSGLGFLLNMYIQTDQIGILKSSRFLDKLTLVFVVAANGVVFHFKVFPMFKRIIDKPLSRIKGRQLWLLSITGAISATTWYSIVILSVWRAIPLSYWQVLGVYVLVLAGAILSARFFFAKLLKR